MLRSILRAVPAATGLALVLGLGACGSGGGGDDSANADDTKAADSISKSLTAENDEVFKVTDEQADCVGEGFVEDIGTDQLTEYGILTEDLEATDEALDIKMEQADAETSAGAMVECTGTKLFVNAILEQAGDVPPETAACVKGVVDEQLLREVFTKAFQGADDDEVGRPMVAAVEGCE